MSPIVRFQETDAQRRVESVPLSHLSIELGHVYAEDFGPGNEWLYRHFERIAPYTELIRRDCEARLPRGVKPRISTCFLIDDYYNRFGHPGDVIQVVRDAAKKYGIALDYIAREAGCAVADGIPLAKLVENRLVADPPPNTTTGGRPPATESGWLCNGERTPALDAGPAMTPAAKWMPPAENGANPHSVFGDIQLWSEERDDRLWSCSFLASVWQLVRLGVLRHLREVAVRPYKLDLDRYEFPDDWDRLPAVMQVNDRAMPFAAYRTMSILPVRFLPIEFAVRTILSQVSIDPPVTEQLAKRASEEGIGLPEEIISRIGYLLLND